MPYEVDYIPVGEKGKSGDAITIRFGNLAGSRSEQVVVIIDAGFQGSGEALVDHILKYYKTDVVDLAVSTHPDADHISGMLNVLNGLHVKCLLMHQPWNCSAEILQLFKNPRLTEAGLVHRIQESLDQAKEVEVLAQKKSIKIVNPYQGVNGYGDKLLVLGPSEPYYKLLVPLFRGTPAPKEGLVSLLEKMSEIAVDWIADSFAMDLLDDDNDSTSAENSSSVIMLFQIDGRKLLFTGDAGKTALHYAVDYADSRGISLKDLKLLDVPHHGSKRNLSSKVLQRIQAEVASISASKESDHPSKRVTNALVKLGAKVYVNREKTLRHSYMAPIRDGWVSAVEEPFHERFQE